MAAIVNDRDVLIMSAVPRYNAPANRDMFLSPPSAIFKVAADGLSASPSSLAFQATLLNLAGTVTFTASAGLTLSVSGNTATLTFANFTSANGTITASITVDGVTYTKVSTVTKLADGAPGTPGLNSPPQTAAQLKDTLLGQITTSQFVTGLQSTIGLIDAPATTAGSVSARVKAETDARVTAISTEVTDRGAAITAAMNAEVAARNTAIVNYGYTKEASDSSLATLGTTITAAYKTYTDAKTGQALTDAKAFVQGYSYSIADANSAIAASASTLNANIASAVSTARAYTEFWGYSKAAVDTAETAQFNSLTANYRGYADGVGAAATSAAAADVRGYTMATSTINSAIAASSTALTTSYTNAIAAVKVAGQNLVIDSAFERGLRPWTSKTAAVASVDIRGSAGARYLFIQSISTANAENDAYVNGDGPDIPVAPGVQYVIAFDYATAQSSSIIGSSSYMYMFYSNGAGAGVLGLPIPVNDTGSVRLRASQVWTCPAGVTSLRPRFGIRTTGYAWMAIYNFMVAAGNKDPGYSPAPEDAPALANAAQVAAATDVRSYTMSSSGITGAISSATTSLTSSFQSADASNLTAAKSYADSAITNYTYSKSDITGAIAGSASTITARLNNAGGAGVSVEQSFTAQASAITGLSGQWAIKLNVAGQVAGIGLASSSATGAPTSIFTVVADKFALAYPGVNSKIPFVIGKVAGQSVIGLDGTVVIDGSLTARTLAVGAVTASSLLVGTSDNIVLDPAFHDLAWWGRDGGRGSAGYWADAGQVTGWLAGASLYLAASAGELITYSSPFPITPGATYLVQCQVSLSSNFNGRMSAYWTIPGVVDYSMIDRNAGQTWADGLPVHLNSSSPKGLVTFTTTYKVPLTNQLARGVIQIRNSHTVGTVEIGSVSITRMADDALVVNGGIKARHIQVDTMAAIQAELGSAVISTAGSLRSGQTGYNAGTGFYMGIDGGIPKLSMGVAGGKGIRWDGSNVIINGGVLISPQISTSFAITIPGLTLRNQVNSGSYQGFGTFTSSMANGVGPFNYQWTFSVENGDIKMVGDPNSASVQIQARGTNAYISAYLSLTVRDSNNAIASSGSSITIQFGSGVAN